MPCTPISPMAARTSSSLKGLMMAVMNFMVRMFPSLIAITAPLVCREAEATIRGGDGDSQTKIFSAMDEPHSSWRKLTGCGRVPALIDSAEFLQRPTHQRRNFRLVGVLQPAGEGICLP